MSHKVSVLFVCLGNICRSPTAHAVFRQLVRDAGLEQKIAIDSAGTSNYHPGKPADPRTIETAKNRGLDMTDLRARQVNMADFIEHDYILVMDDSNYANMMDIAPRDLQGKVKFFLDFAPELGIKHVPDPYFGGPQGFEDVFDMVEVASANLLAEIREKFAL